MENIGNEEEKILPEIIKSVDSFLNNYPEKTGVIANIFLVAIRLSKIKSRIITQTAQPIASLKLTIMNAEQRKRVIPKPEYELDRHIYNIQMAVQSLKKIKAKNTKIAVIDYFTELKNKKPSFESFIKNELKIIKYIQAVKKDSIFST